ncbi:MAG: hypothetical protein KAX68_05130, partial [Giesbergeria sp.]|nr:hypothetical protein [Giesbergeria sp.]
AQAGTCKDGQGGGAKVFQGKNPQVVRLHKKINAKRSGACALGGKKPVDLPRGRQQAQVCCMDWLIGPP